MPIISLQKRLRQSGRIRIGAKVATKNGGTRPDKLETFRITSPDQNVVQAIAEIYGGDVQPWEDAPIGDQWEVYTKSTSLDVLVPPADISYSSFMELWSGAGCQRRCDGETELLTDSPCMCDKDNLSCKPTTRLNVILSAIEGVGVFRLESHGWNAASELAGTIDVLRAIHPNTMVPGRLVLEQRQSKRIDPKTGKQETYNFSVPNLDLKVSVASLGVSEPVPGVTPIQSAPTVLPSISDQVLAATEHTPKPKRANAAAELPSTGLKPRSVAQDKTEGGASQASMRRLFAIVNGNKDIDSSDDGRKAWASTILGRAVTTFNNLTPEEIQELSDIAPTYKNPDKQPTLDAQAPF